MISLTFKDEEDLDKKRGTTVDLLSSSSEHEVLLQNADGSRAEYWALVNGNPEKVLEGTVAQIEEDLSPYTRSKE